MGYLEVSHVSIGCLGSSFLLVGNQTHTDEFAEKLGCSYANGILVEVIDLWVIYPPCCTARRMSQLWNAAGRPCGWNELTSKGVHKSYCHASQDCLHPPRPPAMHPPTLFSFSSVVLQCSLDLDVAPLYVHTLSIDHSAQTLLVIICHLCYRILYPHTPDSSINHSRREEWWRGSGGPKHVLT